MSQSPVDRSQAPYIKKQQLLGAGGYLNETAEVTVCRDDIALEKVLSWAKAQQKKLTIMGAARSFGEQFAPSPDSIVVDVSELNRGAEIIGTLPGDRLLIRAGAGTRFCDLHELFPKWRVSYPPTSDRITIAGALAACTHNSKSYFADAVHAFTLLSAEGERFHCDAKSEGIEAELFRTVPGAFGALGIVTSVELILKAIHPKQLIAVETTFESSKTDSSAFHAMRQAASDPRYTEGAGAVIYGIAGSCRVMADYLLPLDHIPDKNQALLTDDDIDHHALTQGIVNRFPRIAQFVIERAYRAGSFRWAPWYGFDFFHRGYERSYDILSRPGLKTRLLKSFGVQATIPILHQSWFFPESRLEAVTEKYWQHLRSHPKLASYIEQQDFVLLPPCPYPAHSLGSGIPERTTPSGADVTHIAIGCLTVSFSLAASGKEKGLLFKQLLEKFSRSCHEEFGDVRVSLCKQLHCDREILRAMHKSWIDLILPLRERLDPQGRIISRHLQTLLPE